MLDSLSNQALFKKKFNDLVRFKQILNPVLFPHTVCCDYHGINLCFKTKSPKFIQSLKKLVPKDWLVLPPPGGKVIYLMTPEEFNNSLQSWGDETSQDCLSLENNSIAIQRDFAAHILEQEVLLICEDSVSDGFYNFLRWYLSEKLMNIGKYVLHASSVLDKFNEAHLFLGHSGAGKTTITELSTPRLVLGDDMNLVSLENGHLMAEAGAIGGQFNSMIGYDQKRPVKACYWLKQDRVNSLREIAASEASQKFLASFANLYWPTLPESKIAQLMKFSTQALSQTKFYQLHFINTPAIWEYLDP